MPGLPGVYYKYNIEDFDHCGTAAYARTTEIMDQRELQDRERKRERVAAGRRDGGQTAAMPSHDAGHRPAVGLDTNESPTLARKREISAMRPFEEAGSDC